MTQLKPDCQHKSFVILISLLLANRSQWEKENKLEQPDNFLSCTGF
uniref:Uncharacterized protein n=1 Tax=Arundo donax TaxID=35708 RepID=A0A0A9G7Y0_ARUDO